MLLTLLVGFGKKKEGDETAKAPTTGVAKVPSVEPVNEDDNTVDKDVSKDPTTVPPSTQPVSSQPAQLPGKDTKNEQPGVDTTVKSDTVAVVGLNTSGKETKTPGTSTAATAPVVSAAGGGPVVGQTDKAKDTIVETPPSKTPVTDSPSDITKPAAGLYSRLTGGVPSISFFGNKGNKEGSKDGGSKDGGSKDNLPALAPTVTPDGSKKHETGSKETPPIDKKTTATGDDTGNSSDNDKKRGQKNNNMAGGGPGGATTGNGGNKAGMPSNLMPKTPETTSADGTKTAGVTSNALGSVIAPPTGPYCHRQYH